MLLTVNAKRVCNSVRYGGECLASRPARFTPWKQPWHPLSIGRKPVWVPWRKSTYPSSLESNIQIYSKYCNEIFALLRCYAANISSSLPTFRDNLSGPTFKCQADLDTWKWVVPKRRQRTINIRCVTSQKSKISLVPRRKSEMTNCCNISNTSFEYEILQTMGFPADTENHISSTALSTKTYGTN